jgi:hypothetical protein
MRFYSNWIHIIWLYKLVDYYYCFSNKNWNTVAIVLYGVLGGSDYANRMYPVWHNRLHAVNENPNVADRFSIWEFVVSNIASVCSVYWFFDSHILPWIWLVLLVFAWVGDYMLRKAWRHHLTKLQRAAYKHCPTV